LTKRRRSVWPEVGGGWADTSISWAKRGKNRRDPKPPASKKNFHVKRGDAPQRKRRLVNRKLRLNEKAKTNLITKRDGKEEHS